jgi:hypothetical protein
MSPSLLSERTPSNPCSLRVPPTLLDMFPPRWINSVKVTGRSDVAVWRLEVSILRLSLSLLFVLRCRPRLRPFPLPPPSLTTAQNNKSDTQVVLRDAFLLWPDSTTSAVVLSRGGLAHHRARLDHPSLCLILAASEIDTIFLLSCCDGRVRGWAPSSCISWSFVVARPVCPFIIVVSCWLSPCVVLTVMLV